MKTKQQHFEDYKIAQMEYVELDNQLMAIRDIYENSYGETARLLKEAAQLIYKDLIKAQKEANKSAKLLLSPTKDKPTVIDNDPF